MSFGYYTREERLARHAARRLGKVEPMNNMNLISFSLILTLLFAGARLLNVITWSWWWVFSPILFWPAAFAVFLFGVFMLACVGAYFEERRRG